MHSQPSASTDPQPGIKSTIFNLLLVEPADVNSGGRRAVYLLKNLCGSYLFRPTVNCITCTEALFSICLNLVLSWEVHPSARGGSRARAPGWVWRPGVFWYGPVTMYS